MKNFPERKETKKGEAKNQENFVTRDNKGIKVDGNRAVFPILIEKNDKTEFLATGFFISSTGIFVTAKHVIEEAVNKKTGQPLHPLIIVESLGNNQVSFRRITYTTFLGNSDISIGVCAGNLDEKNELITNKKLVLSRKDMKIDYDVHTYAFPNSVTTENNGQTEIYTNPKFYDGKIVENFPKGRDKTMLPNPCYQTSIHIYGGASGGPVFCGFSGTVIGMNSTSLSFAPEVSFISKLIDLEDFIVPDGGIDKFISIGQLIELGAITYE